jgi:hypothetical protein
MICRVVSCRAVPATSSCDELNCYSSEEIATDGHEGMHQTPPTLWGMDDMVRTDTEKRTGGKEDLNADGSGGFRGVAVEDAFLILHRHFD